MLGGWGCSVNETAQRQTLTRKREPVFISDLKGKTLFITGASRGIGLAIGIRAAGDGANVAIAAKTTKPHPKLPGTIFTAAEDIESAGGKALAIQCDIRHEDQIEAAMAETAETFGGIDILVNNASAISLTPTTATPMKRYDLMHQINVRGTYACCHLAHKYLAKGDNPHILTLSPPLDMQPKWFASYVAYSMAKYGMSMCTLGMAEEFKEDGIACNSLWPRTVIATAALALVPGVEIKNARKPDIMADAAYTILTRDSRSCTGNFYIDDEILAEEDITEFGRYAQDPSQKLLPDLYIEKV